MHARVSTYDLSPDMIEDGIRGFREATDRIRELEGIHEVFLLVDRENGQAVTITLWEDAQTMASSRVAARSGSPDRSDATVAASTR